MANTLFTNVRIFDGTGEHPYLGEALVQGNRIKHVARGIRTVPANGHTVIDGAGATLMPGLTEAHAHFSWNNAASLDAIFRMPPEEHTLLSANSARLYLDMGFTSCVGAAAAKPRLDVVIRNAIDSDEIGVPEKIAILTHGISQLPDIVALQITLEGSSLPLVVSQRDLRQALRRVPAVGQTYFRGLARALPQRRF